MSLLDSLGTAKAVKTSGPTQYTAAASALYDESTGRTYQLCERVSDHVPHCVSRAGNHADAMLAQLNTLRKLTHERGQLADSIKPDAVKPLSAAEVKAARVQIDALSAKIKALPAVQVDRIDRSARMLYLYELRGE